MTVITGENPVFQITQITSRWVLAVALRLGNALIQSVVSGVIDNLCIVALFDNFRTLVLQPLIELICSAGCVDDDVCAVGRLSILIVSVS